MEDSICNWLGNQGWVDAATPERWTGGWGAAACADLMLRAGVEDLICNWLGNQRWVDVLPWTGVHGWKAAPEKAWAVDAKTVGSVRSYGGLSFVKVRQPVGAAGAGAVLLLLGTSSLWADAGGDMCPMLSIGP